MAQRRVRILHAVGTMDPGGIEVWLLNVLKYIDRDLFEFHFCTFGSHPGLLAGDVERLGGRVLPCPRGVNPWSFGRRFRKILHDGNYDAVHSHVTLFSGAVLRWAQAEGIPMRIAHSHVSQDDKPDSHARRYYRWTMKSWIDRYSTRGLAASQIAAALLFGDAWETDRRFQILHCGIDLLPFQDSVARDQVRSELGVPPGAPVVGHVGRFELQKNHRFLLGVFGEIQKRVPNVHFLLVGDGPLRAQVQAQSDAMGLSGKMHFVGIRTDVARLMRGGMDVFVFPSLFEGLPIAVIEAQAAGLGCVVSDTVTGEARVLGDQFTQLSLSKRPEEWAATAVEALQKGKAEAGLALQAVAQSDFCIQRSIPTLSNLYVTPGA
jgi:glycosyltransferase involved in cell wall biosynthesis